MFKDSDLVVYKGVIAEYGILKHFVYVNAEVRYANLKEATKWINRPDK